MSKYREPFGLFPVFGYCKAIAPWPLAGRLRWGEHHPGHQKAAGSIPGQDACEATNLCFSLTLIFFFLFFPLSPAPFLPLSLKINKNISPVRINPKKGNLL